VWENPHEESGNEWLKPVKRNCLVDSYKYKVRLRNDATKTIKSIDWDYLFLDPMTQQELAGHQFTNDETIKPGKSKEISVLYLMPPVKLISARRLNKKNLPFTE
jgi:hypothetical protein